MTRHRWVLPTVIAVVVVGALAVGWVAATVFTSPAQVAAERRPAHEKPITVAVKKGDLSRQATIAATVGWRRQLSVPIAADDSRAYVTATPLKAGKAVHSLASLLEVNGRPRLLIDGRFPLYRTLSPGMTGPDVRELQAALSAAGYEVIVDGQFGSGTAAAISAAYEKAGYDPPTESEGVAAPPADDDADDGSAASSSGETVAEPDDTRVLALPPTEFIVAPKTPVTVTTLPAVGSPVGADSSIGLGIGDLVATADVPATVAAPLRKGQTATLTLPDKRTVTATITGVRRVKDGATSEDAAGASPVPDSDSEETWRVTFAPDDDLAAGSAGSQTVATIEVTPIADDALIVPTTAVVPGGGDPAHVLVQRADSFVAVDVREIGVLDGRSAVEPVTAGELAEGDLVRVR